MHGCKISSLGSYNCVRFGMRDVALEDLDDIIFSTVQRYCECRNRNFLKLRTVMFFRKSFFHYYWTFSIHQSSFFDNHGARASLCTPRHNPINLNQLKLVRKWYSLSFCTFYLHGTLSNVSLDILKILLCDLFSSFLPNFFISLSQSENYLISLNLSICMFWVQPIFFHWTTLRDLG